MKYFAIFLFAAILPPSGLAQTFHPIVLRPVASDVAPDQIEFLGVSPGAFNLTMWQTGHLHLVADARSPMLEPLSGKFRNIYAPSAVQTPDGWRLFYGAWDGIDTGNDHLYSVET